MTTKSHYLNRKTEFKSVLEKTLLEIWTVPNFLSDKECEDLIFFSEMRGFQEATVGLKSGAKMLKSVRDNYRLEYDDKGLADRL